MIQMYGMNDRIGNLAFPKQASRMSPPFSPSPSLPLTLPTPHALALAHSPRHGTRHACTPAPQEGAFGMEQRVYSEVTAQTMDEEAKKMVDEAYT